MQNCSISQCESRVGGEAHRFGVEMSDAELPSAKRAKPSTNFFAVYSSSDDEDGPAAATPAPPVTRCCVQCGCSVGEPAEGEEEEGEEDTYCATCWEAWTPPEEGQSKEPPAPPTAEQIKAMSDAVARNHYLRTTLANDPGALSAEDRERAELLATRGQRRKEKLKAKQNASRSEPEPEPERKRIKKSQEQTCMRNPVPAPAASPAKQTEQSGDDSLAAELAAANAMVLALQLAAAQAKVNCNS